MRVLCLLAPLLVCGCTLFNVNVSLFGEEGELEEHVLQESDSDAKVALVTVDGLIHSGRGVSFFGDAGTVECLKEQLNRAAVDEDVAAVVLRINSPGGEAVASDLMWHEVRRFRKRTGKPVAAWISGVGASGAYYLACGADAIVAHPNSVVGSIGVIVHLVNLKGLMDKLGLGVEVIKSGARKDTGSPFRELTEQERVDVQGMINRLYERFLGIVAEARGRDKNALRPIADGRVMGAEAARAAGLVDAVGYLEDALSIAMKKAKLKRAKLVQYQRPGTWRPNVYSPWATMRRLDALLEPGLWMIAPQFFSGSDE